MNKIIGLLAVGVCVLVTKQARGAIVTGAAVWNFDSGTKNLNAYAGTLPYGANTLNTAVFNAGNMSAATASSGNATQGAGTGFNGLGKALQFTAQNGNGKSVNGSSFVLSLTIPAGVSSISSITIHYDYLATSGAGTALNTWTLSGVTGSQTAAITQNTGWNSATVTFSGLSLGAGTITLTDALSGYAAGNANNIAGFDNISFDVSGPTLVPEPITYAMALFGLIFVSGGVGRYYIGNARQKA